jgi:hypothetical protein
LVLKHRHHYNETVNRSKKRDIVREIVAGIPNNGRFLKHCGDRWVVLSEEKVLAKTAQALRYRVRIERNIAAVASQAAVPSQPHRLAEAQPEPAPVQERLGFGDAPSPTVQAQETLKMYSQWMLRANAVFWEQMVGPEARALFPEDMIAAVPISSKYETSFPSSSEG